MMITTEVENVKMEDLDLSSLGAAELDDGEMQEVDGGFIVISTAGLAAIIVAAGGAGVALGVALYNEWDDGD